MTEQKTRTETETETVEAEPEPEQLEVTTVEETAHTETTETDA